MKCHHFRAEVEPLPANPRPLKLYVEVSLYTLTSWNETDNPQLVRSTGLKRRQSAYGIAGKTYFYDVILFGCDDVDAVATIPTRALILALDAEWDDLAGHHAATAVDFSCARTSMSAVIFPLLNLIIAA